MNMRFFPNAAGSPGIRTYSLLYRVFALVLVLLTAGLAGGCGDDPVSSGDTPSATAGHIKGKVVDYQGKGIPGVKVGIHTSTFGGGVVTAATATTKADGTYDVTLPDGVYGVNAEHTTMYNGRQYREYMSPDDGINGDLIHESKKGYVKNFTWKISGEIPGYAFVPGQAHHYGGYVNLGGERDYNYRMGNHSAPDGEKVPVGSTIEVTMTPDGPRLDGSQGEVVKRSYLVGGEYWYNTEYDLLDIPVGRYNVSAVLVDGNGGRRNLRVSTRPGNDLNVKPTTPGASSVLEFWPLDFSVLTHGTWGTALFVLM